MIDSTFTINFAIRPAGKNVIDAITQVRNAESIPGCLNRIFAPMFGGDPWTIQALTETNFQLVRDFNGIEPEKVEVIRKNLQSMWYANYETLHRLYDIENITIHADGESSTWAFDKGVSSIFKTITLYVENNPHIASQLMQSGLFEDYEIDSICEVLNIGPDEFIPGSEPLCCTITIYEGGHDFEYSRQLLDL